MRRPIDFEQLEDAMHLASEGVKFARKCVQRAARMQKGQNNAHRRPRPCRKARRRPGPKRIGPAPGHTPKELPPVGEKWVHVGDGTFITLRRYKQQQRAQRDRERGWGS